MKAKVILATVLVLTVLLTLTWQINTAKCQVVEDGLVSYWTFESTEVDGNVVNDVWGENNGTLMGDALIGEGKIGEGMHLDGSGDYLAVPDHETLELSAEVTLEAWVKLITSGSDQAIIEKGDCYYLLNVFGPGRPTVGIIEFGCSSLAPNWLSGTGVVDDDEWHHVVGVYDGSNKYIYIDGEEDIVGATTGTLSGIVNNNLSIGRRGAQLNNRFGKGIIDEARIYNRGLSADEVEANFAAEGLAVAKSTNALAVTWGKIKVSR